MDGISWTNSQGESFYIYHFVDQGTTYRTAVCVPSGSSENAIQALLQGWLQWAGPPRMLVLDAGADLNSEQFSQFLQKYGMCSRTCAADARWQNARVERHAGTLQMMITKMDQEESLSNHQLVSMALMHATSTKNKWSRLRGYPPELLVFGKSTRVPGSIFADDSRAAHSMALAPVPEV